MSDEASKTQSNAVALPDEVRAHFNGELDRASIVAWAEFDLDERNQYARRFAVLTEKDLVIVAENAGSATRAIPIASITEAAIVEGLGVDRLNIIADGKRVAEMRYTRRTRREMSRLQRKLERRLPRKAGEEKDLPPDWLETVERREEATEHCAKCRGVIPAYAEGVCPRCQQTRKVLWRLMDVARPYRSRVWAALALTIVVTALSTLPAIFLKQLVDGSLDMERQAGGLSLDARVRNLFFWSGAIVIAVLVTQTLGGARLHLLTALGTRVARDLRHQVYEHLHGLSLRFFAKRRTGSLITRVTTDTDRLWDFIVFGSVNMVRDLLMIFVFAGVMFFFNWRLAIAALLPVPPLAIVTYYRSMKMQAMFGRLWTYWSRMTAVVGDALPGVRVVKAFANEQRELTRFDRRSDEYTVHEQEVNQVWATLQPIIAATMHLGRTLVWAVGGWLIIRHPSAQNSLGTLFMFNAFVTQFYEPIMELANSNRMVTRAATSAQRVFEVLDTAPEIYSASKALTKPQLDGRVEFKQVSFSYEGAQPALREISLVVAPGEMVGLCGPSGAGKSTFVNLICRFYDATDGQILIDGVDIRDYDVKWLRRQIGLVLQEPYLFHGTIADNVRYGNPDASDAEVITAAKAANAHDFVVGFPDGYDTMVGERGQSLSGGERQRISIARAILHNPRILILDEATSSVDTETEKQIQQALDRLVEGRTTFAIAHRLSTLQAADRLVVLEKGKVVEQGVHSELVDKDGGVYAKLHRTQVEMSSTLALT
ncbi:MAG: ATP-binding cassette, subfamily bacterial [Phycisphaerales bacterium]|nr:ATP-binding cassette, subfamily bacterial [Phycisphaerales bacterium]